MRDARAYVLLHVPTVRNLVPPGYLLGEFGHLLQTGPAEYFALLQQRFAACGLPTKALLLSAYAKVRWHGGVPPSSPSLESRLTV